MIRPASLVFAAMAIATAANAGPQSVAAHQVVVSYGDLNLANPRDAAALRDRITKAATRACGGQPAFSSDYRDAPLYMRHAFEQCRQTAIRAALTQVHGRLARD